MFKTIKEILLFHKNSTGKKDEVLTCSPMTAFGKLLKVIVTKGITRVWVVNTTKQLIGVISVTSIFDSILQMKQEKLDGFFLKTFYFTHL